MNIVQKQIVKLLLNNAGPYLQKGVTAAAAALSAWLIAHVPQLTGHVNEVMLTGILWALLDAVVTQLAAGPLKEYGAQLQRLLNRKGASLNEDAFVGPKTVAAARQLLNDK